MGQRDFRQQDQHLLALLERRRHRLEIDFRLARSGDAVEQRDVEARRPRHWRAASMRPLALVRHQLRHGIARDRARPPPGAAGSSPSRTRLAPSALDDRRRHAGGMRQADRVQASPPSAVSSTRAARRGHPVGHRPACVAGPRSRVPGRRPPAREAACAPPCRAATACIARPSRRSGAWPGRSAGSRRPARSAAASWHRPSRPRRPRRCRPPGAARAARARSTPAPRACRRHGIGVGAFGRHRHQHRRGRDKGQIFDHEA